MSPITPSKSDVIERFQEGEWRQTSTDGLEEIKAQLNVDERQMLHFLAKEYYQGKGEIVDAGSFLGGSTSCLAIGLRENAIVSSEEKSSRIHSYDLFRYGGWISPKWIDPGQLKDGGSFLHMYHDNLRGLEHYLTIHPGDIRDTCWRYGCIEILFLDVCKTPSINDHVMRMFLPRVVPNRTVLIQQDYAHPSWNIVIYATIYRLRKKMEMIGEARRNSVAFLITDHVSDAEIDACCALKMSHEERIELASLEADLWEKKSFQRRTILESIDTYARYVSEGHPVLNA